MQCRSIRLRVILTDIHFYTLVDGAAIFDISDAAQGIISYSRIVVAVYRRSATIFRCVAQVQQNIVPSIPAAHP